MIPDQKKLEKVVSELPLSPEERGYARMNLRRYRVALRIVAALLDRRRAELGPAAELNLLDVGPHLLTELFAYSLGIPVNTAGVDFRVPGLAVRPHLHLEIDLNEAHDWAGWRGFVQHDVVYMGEILEHLHASPRQVLGCVSRWVKEGGFLVVQTPNAVALSRRLVLLMGKNPYEMIRDGSNPGHFREYTLHELKEIGEFWQLEFVAARFENYFTLRHRGEIGSLIYGLFTRVPRTLRDGMTVIFRKRPGTPDPGALSRHLVGRVESLTCDGATIDARGFCVDPLRDGPADLVHAIIDGTYVTAVRPELPRPDVAASLGANPRYRACGFHLRHPAPPDFNLSRLTLRARDLYGDHKDLPFP